MAWLFWPMWWQMWGGCDVRIVTIVFNVIQHSSTWWLCSIAMLEPEVRGSHSRTMFFVVCLYRSRAGTVNLLKGGWRDLGSACVVLLRETTADQPLVDVCVCVRPCACVRVLVCVRAHVLVSIPFLDVISCFWTSTMSLLPLLRCAARRFGPLRGRWGPPFPMPWWSW